MGSTLQEKFSRLSPEHQAEVQARVAELLREEGVDPEEGYSEIEVDLTDEEFLQVARLAHEHAITFNDMVVEILKAYIEEQDDGTSND